MKVRIETHGCKLNMADSQAMASRFLAAGFDMVTADDVPDVYVLNSCTVTQVADRKARQALSKARRSFPGAVIVASGCYPARAAGEVERLPSVDLVVPNARKSELVGLVKARLAPGDRPSPDRDSVAVAPAELGRTRASVKIQEGCDQVCAYCIVPKVRGRERSIPMNTIVSQIDRLVEAGYLEVVLTGTQLGTYGFDLEDVNLPTLLRTILRRTAIRRLRISSLQPLEITPELLATWNEEGSGRLCPHFHVPLQSGSDKVLKQMRRRYDSSQFLEAVERVRTAVPECSVTTDIIAGFPGETEEDHAATLDVVEHARFADSHVFPYSERPGTSAAHFGGSLDPQARAQRAAELRGVTAAHALEHRRGFVGTTRQVLWEGPERRTGLTDNYLRVVRQGRGVRDHLKKATDVIEDVRLTDLRDGVLIADS